MLIQFDSKVEGCAVDLYRFNPSIGLKMSKLLSYVADIEQVVGVSGVRVLAPIPNTSLIGFEVPRAVRTFPEVIPPQDQENPFNLAIGVDIMGDPYYFDITKAPHMLIAGATGSGKSVFLNSVISQLAQIENLDLPQDFLDNAHNIRMKYHPKSGSILEHKSSHYNASHITGGLCENCKMNVAVDVHHLVFQNEADKTGTIKKKGLLFKKNEKANLMSLCETCHDEIHKSNKKLKRTKTTKGTILVDVGY
jgi:hypothetical protein